MARTITIKLGPRGHSISYKYLIRGDWTCKELRSQFESFKEKHPNTTWTFNRWLVGFGKVYLDLNQEK
jgi:hypothetical protein